MKRFLKAGRVCALVSAVGLCLPGAAVLAGDTNTPSKGKGNAKQTLALDVALSQEGTLEGVTVNSDGTAAIDAKVALRGVDQKVLQANVDENGRFSFTAVRPGVYEVAAVNKTGSARRVVRVWNGKAAPPAATPVAVVTLLDQQAKDLARAQGMADGLFGGSADPLLIGGVALGVAAAIAIPIAVSNNNDPSSP